MLKVNPLLKHNDNYVKMPKSWCQWRQQRYVYQALQSAMEGLHPVLLSTVSLVPGTYA